MSYSAEARLNVPIEKLRHLCKAIVEEDDPETLTRLIAELTEHLQQDQNAIKAKISQFKGLARHWQPLLTQIHHAKPPNTVNPVLDDPDNFASHEAHRMAIEIEQRIAELGDLAASARKQQREEAKRFREPPKGRRQSKWKISLRDSGSTRKVKTSLNTP
jgi:hypothetical protein